MKILGPLDFGDLAFITAVLAWADIVCTLYPQDLKELEGMHEEDEE